MLVTARQQAHGGETPSSHDIIPTLFGDPLIQTLDFGGEVRCVGSVDIGVVRIGRSQTLGDIAHVNHAISRVLPRMWVNRCRRALSHQPLFHRGTGGNPLSMKTGGAAKSCHPALQAQTVLDQQRRRAERSGISGGGLIHVSIRFRRHQTGHADQTTTDAPRHIREDRETRHDPDL